jgi:hypothetical protein
MRCNCFLQSQNCRAYHLKMNLANSHRKSGALETQFATPATINALTIRRPAAAARTAKTNRPRDTTARIRRKRLMPDSMFPG